MRTLRSGVLSAFLARARSKISSQSLHRPSEKLSSFNNGQSVPVLEGCKLSNNSDGVWHCINPSTSKAGSKWNGGSCCIGFERFMLCSHITRTCASDSGLNHSAPGRVYVYTDSAFKIPAATRTMQNERLAPSNRISWIQSTSVFLQGSHPTREREKSCIKSEKSAKKRKKALKSVKKHEKKFEKWGKV
jgi:hypothetical protein